MDFSFLSSSGFFQVFVRLTEPSHTVSLVSRWGRVAALCLMGAGGAPASSPPLEVRAATPVHGSELVHAVVESGDRAGLERLFAAGVAVDIVLPNGDTPLLHALRRGHPVLAAVCLDWCARTDAVTADGLTALTLAVVTRQPALAAQLVEAGADPNTPLPVPVATVVLDAFEQPWFLTQLRHDADLTPLMLAAVLGDEEVVRTFLAHGGRPYQRTRRYTTDALSLACHAGQIRTAQCLLRRDPDDQSGQKLVVVLGEQRVTLFRGDDVVLTSKVSTGRKGYATPPGDYLITSKHRDWTSTIYKAPMPYLLRLNASAIGLHQGVVPGYPASHGCIRLPAGKAADFFKTAQVGDRVLIRH